jgi:DNA polymerase-1
MSHINSSTVILIDGKNYAFRHGFTQQQLFSKKRPTGMLYGAITGLARLARTYPSATFIFCWDGEKRNESWRHRLAKDYKANRSGGGEPPQWVRFIHYQIPIFTYFLKLLGFKQIKIESLEADDLIGIVSEHLKTMVDKVIIYSTDRDFYQLIRKNVYVVRDQDKKKKCAPIKGSEILKEYGVTPKEWLKYRALVGDSGDNILKVKGIRLGPKTAIKLVAAGMDASKREGCNNKKYKKHWDKIRLNYQLSKILRKVDTRLLLTKTCESLNNELRQIKTFSDTQRSAVGKKRKVYKKMLEFFAEYDMEELMRRRKELWEIGK